MANTRCLITTEQKGTATGSAFDDIPGAANLQEATISRIIVAHSTSIHSLEIHYADNKPPAVKRGGAGGTVDDVVLEPSEFITSVEGSASSTGIISLAFVTNRRRLGPFGPRTGEFFIWGAGSRVQPQLMPRMGLLSFRGWCDGIIRMLQATFAEYPGRERVPEIMRYERAPTPPAMLQLQAGGATRAPTLLSRFALHIMSPIATLRVGKKQIEFHAYEDILCRLPFFRAALKGKFKEATEKVIDMPEDEPEIISALVEFLYTGVYTYTYQPRETAFSEDASNTPIRDLTQGLFHVDVYATASKYDCPLLVEGAVRNFTAVLKELKGIDIVRLWKAAYAKGLYLSEWGTDEVLREFKDGLGKLVTVLYSTHREEMEGTMSEFPALGCDLLRLGSTSSTSVG